MGRGEKGERGEEAPTRASQVDCPTANEWLFTQSATPQPGTKSRPTRGACGFQWVQDECNGWCRRREASRLSHIAALMTEPIHHGSMPNQGVKRSLRVPRLGIW